MSITNINTAEYIPAERSLDLIGFIIETFPDVFPNSTLSLLKLCSLSPIEVEQLAVYLEESASKAEWGAPQTGTDSNILEIVHYLQNTEPTKDQIDLTSSDNRHFLQDLVRKNPLFQTLPYDLNPLPDAVLPKLTDPEWLGVNDEMLQLLDKKLQQAEEVANKLKVTVSQNLISESIDKTKNSVSTGRLMFSKIKDLIYIVDRVVEFIMLMESITNSRFQGNTGLRDNFIETFISELITTVEVKGKVGMEILLASEDFKLAESSTELVLARREYLNEVEKLGDIYLRQLQQSHLQQVS